MKICVSTLVLSAIGLVVPYASGAAGGVAGYMDPATGTFVPAEINPPAKTIAATAITRTGTIKVTVTLTIESAIGTDEAINCTTGASTFDASFSNSVTTSAVAVRSGATATATLTMPYDWTMAAAGESVTVSVNCSEGYGTGTFHSVGFSSATFVVPTTAGTVTAKGYTGSL